MVESSEIISALNFLGISSSSINILDSKYSIPTKEWVLNTSKNISYQIDKMLGVWTTESRDCDDFALTTMSLMRLFHSKGNPTTSLPIAYFQYTKQNQGLHAINLAFVDDKKIIFFEPQTGDLLNLTIKEIKSCSRLLI